MDEPQSWMRKGWWVPCSKVLETLVGKPEPDTEVDSDIDRVGLLLQDLQGAASWCWGVNDHTLVSQEHFEKALHALSDKLAADFLAMKLPKHVWIDLEE